jgi:hypothetical protein
VYVQCGSGAPRTLSASVPNGTGATPLAWSSDGTQLAWATGVAMYVALATAGTWTIRQWSCQCSGVAFLGNQAVSVNSSTAGGPQAFSKAVTQLLVFPAAGSGQPSTLPVTGLSAKSIGTEFRLLGSVGPASVVVDYGDGGGTDLGGIQLLYQVNSAGQATDYGHDTGAYPAAPNAPYGVVIDFSVSTGGSELAFGTYSRAGGCGGTFAASVLDAATGVITIPKMPAGGGLEGWAVEGTWFDQAGTPYASLVPNMSTCNSGGLGSGTAVGPLPANAVPIVVKLEGGTWVQAGTGVFQAAYGPGSWLAQEVGRIAQNVDSVTLTVSDGKSPVSVNAGGLTGFAWAPSAASTATARTTSPAPSAS